MPNHSRYFVYFAVYQTLVCALISPLDLQGVESCDRGQSFLSFGILNVLRLAKW